MVHITNFVRTKIAVLFEQQMSIMEIARQLGITKKTVRLWVHRFLSEGDVNGRRLGRKTTGVYTSQCSRHIAIVDIHTRSPFAPTSSTAQQYSISTTTVRRHLHAADLHNYRAAKKIELSELHRSARVRFAEEFLDFDWHNNIVIFTDEKTFRSDTDGRKILWRKRNERYNSQNILPVRASGRITLGYWGWMSSMGPGEIVEISGRMNGEQYLQVLKEVMLPSVRIAYPEGQIYFVHDNCAVHRTRMVSEWLSSQENITVIPWPSKSPDLNPIENMWGHMVLNWDPSELRSKHNLDQEVMRTWELMRGNNMGWNMVTQMRNRLQQIILNGGYPLRY